jgi:branched-subunit amino acid transport protein
VSTDVLVAVIAALAVGTYGFRLAGILLRDRLDLPDRVREVLPMAAAALLAALAATATLFTQAGEAAGVARPVGVLVGVVLAWRKAPFVVVVVAAAATAALLRLAGVE